MQRNRDHPEIIRKRFRGGIFRDKETKGLFGRCANLESLTYYGWLFPILFAKKNLLPHKTWSVLLSSCGKCDECFHDGPLLSWMLV